uniref:UBX domain-containing protein n=1 Tax=Nomascus leucogenys TaxID=61853 RepID=A0A2I3GCT4_NOMLE
LLVTGMGGGCFLAPVSPEGQAASCRPQPRGWVGWVSRGRERVSRGQAPQGASLCPLAPLRFVMKRCDPVGKTPGSLGSSASAGQAAASAPLPLESGDLSHGDLSRREDADTSGPCCEHTQEKQSTRAPAPAPFVPFSGGGQRLGGPPGPTRPLTSSSAKVPKSLSSPGGPSKPKKSKSGQDPQQEREPEPEQEPEPVKGAPVSLCHPGWNAVVRSWPTAASVSQLQAILLPQPPEYGAGAARGWRGGRAVCMLFFSSAVGDLRDFVRRHLGNPELSFYLFITPPKTVLDDHTRTLFQANLFPAALVHFGAEEPAGVYLEPGLLEHAISPSAADVLVARCMSRAAGSPSPLPAPDPAPESEPAAEEGALVPPEPIPGRPSP